MIVFYLVRHAHAVWTPDVNRPLSERGQQDALRVAELLSERPIDAVYASTERRAQQTVAPLAERLGLPLQVTPALDERRLAGGRVHDFQAAVRATWADFSFAHPGGETNAAAQERGLALVYGLLARHATGAGATGAGAQTVLGTHGNLLALIVQGFLPTYGYSYWQTLTMPDVYRLDLPTVGSDPACEPAIERLWIPRQEG